MAFMDALEEASIAVSRTTESFVVSVAAGQEAAWEEIRRRFRLELDEEEPPMFMGS